MKIILTQPDKYQEAITTVNDNQTILLTIARVIDDSLDEDFVHDLCRYINHVGFNRRVLTIESGPRFVSEMSVLVHPTGDIFEDNGQKFTPLEICVFLNERDKLDKRDRSIQFTKRWMVGHDKKNGVLETSSKLYVKPYTAGTYQRFLSDFSVLMDIYYNASKDSFEKELPDPTKGATVIPLTKR